MTDYGERVPQGEGDACYRHPARQSYILCQRCGRTICSDCQTQSAVGVLCPNCMKEGRIPAPTVRKRVQRTLAADTPVVTYGILGLTVVVFLGQLLFPAVTRALMYAPVYSMPFMFEPWRLLTTVFTHSTGFLPHILFNMFALWAFGRQLESYLGRAWFLTLYLVSGFAGSLVVELWGYTGIQAMQTGVVGASGAIFGIFAATFVIGKSLGANMTSLLVMLGINLAIGFMPGVSIAWQAHLGGLLGGAALTYILVKTKGTRKRTARIIGVTALVASLILLSLVFFVISPVALG